jgi:hypothetical protein
MVDNDTKINEVNKHELVNGKLWHFCPEANQNIVDPALVNSLAAGANVSGSTIVSGSGES